MGLNLMSEGVSCGLDKEKARMGYTCAYFPFGLWIERSQMTPYHIKLVHCLLDSYRNSHSRTHHRVVTHTEEAHHLNVCWY